MMLNRPFVILSMVFAMSCGAGHAAEFTIPTANSQPLGIVTGPDGSLWFTESFGNKIGRITPSGTFTEYPIPTPNSSPAGIATGGNPVDIWFTENAGNKIGRITPSGIFTEYPIPAPGLPWGIVEGPDGNMWFTEVGSNKIGRLTPAGVLTEFAIPTLNSKPEGIVKGPDGNLWFTEKDGNKIGRITTSGAITEFALPSPASDPWSITVGPDGALWFTEGNGRIGRITTAGEITEYAITAPGFPYDIVAGSDGNLWFTESSSNKIGRITPAGVITEFNVPTAGAQPWGIARALDGTLWYTERGGNKIGNILPTDTTGVTQAPAQGITGTWTTQGSDWVWFLQANGRGVLVGTGVNHSCAAVSSQASTFSASGGSMSFVGDSKYSCGGDQIPQTPGIVTANYVLGANTLTLSNVLGTDQPVGTLTLTQAPAPTQSVVGTWTSQGIDWVWNFQADGQFVVTGTGAAPRCDIASTVNGSYSASAGVLSFSLDTWTCGGSNFTGAPDNGRGGYVFGGTTLTFFVEKLSGTDVGNVSGFILIPQGGTTTTPLTPGTPVPPNTPLPPRPTTQSVFTVPSGQMPAAAVQVTAEGTFGSANLRVTLDLSLPVASFPGQGHFAAGYNVYVAALVPGAALGAASPAWYVKPAAPANWTPLQLPIAAFLENVAQGTTNVQVDILSNTDLSSLVGTEFYVGYGTSSDEMLAANRYRGVYKAQ